MQQMSVRRLLNRRVASVYLNRFTELLPEVSIALVDNFERVVVRVGPGDSEAPISGNVAQPETDWAISLPLEKGNQYVGNLVAKGSGLQRPGAKERLELLHHSLMLIIERSIESRSLAQETLDRYREINLLYNIGETISASLDADEIPDLVMAEATRIIRADGGIVVLLEKNQKLVVQSGFGTDDFMSVLHKAPASLLSQALVSGEPHIWTSQQLDFSTTTVDAVLEAPLKAREHILGFVLLGREPGQPIFSADDEKLLVALASQAAIAVENARLFADVKAQRDAISEMKNYMDNIFASIASGVITTDTQDLVTLSNRAAERILGVSSSEMMGKHYLEALPEMGSKISKLIEVVKKEDESVVGYEMEPILPTRGSVVLRLNLSPLKDNRERTNGIAIVVDDLTERRQLEDQARRIRKTFEQYVVPHVVEQLLSDPNSVRLGGARREVTTLFADIRGFTAFSEKLEPEASVEVLNRYLTLASEAILSEEGTLDKFFGDGVMAIFNAPLAQADHTLRAIRSALTILSTLKKMHKELPPANRLAFGIGITTGHAVVGSIGSTQIRNYTAIGDSVNLASRLQSHATPGQILLSAPAYHLVSDQVISRDLGYIQVKGHSEPDLVFEVLGLKE